MHVWHAWGYSKSWYSEGTNCNIKLLIFYDEIQAVYEVCREKWIIFCHTARFYPDLGAWL